MLGVVFASRNAYSWTVKINSPFSGERKWMHGSNFTRYKHRGYVASSAALTAVTPVFAGYICGASGRPFLGCNVNKNITSDWSDAS